MSTASVPTIQYDKMVVSDILFRQRAVTEFCVKENNLAAGICQQLRCVYGHAFIVRRWVKQFIKTEIADIWTSKCVPGLHSRNIRMNVIISF